MNGGRGEVRRHVDETSAFEGSSPYTFEGEIDGLARFATGLRRSRGGPKRNIGVLLVVSMVMLPFFAGTIQLFVLALKAIF